MNLPERRRLADFLALQLDRNGFALAAVQHAGELGLLADRRRPPVPVRSRFSTCKTMPVMTLLPQTRHRPAGSRLVPGVKLERRASTGRSWTRQSAALTKTAGRLMAQTEAKHRRGGKAMAVSLYEASVERFLQNLEGAAGVLKKGREHFTAAGTDLNEIAQHRFWEDMQPLSFQVVSVAHHSIARSKVSKAASLARRRAICAAMTTLKRSSPTRAPGCLRSSLARSMRWPISRWCSRPAPREMRFTGAGFLLSFSLPNSISTPPPPTTSFAPRACRSASAITWASRALRPDAPS